MDAFIITIDGPAGSGKTTLAKLIAQRLKLSLLETGAFYRAITYFFMQNGCHKINDFTSNEEIINKLQDIFSKIKVEISLTGTTLYYQGKPLKEELRTKEVEGKVSEFSAHPTVREFVTGLLRDLVKDKKVITEGRDMGSIVFPFAKIKIFLTADLNERAKRRWKDYPERDLEEIKHNLMLRDELDTQREVAPLVIPEGAIIIDTTNLSIDEAVEKIISIINERLCDKMK
ncbi:MAG: (d)CMP kinase [Caldimicrobium sp.]